MIQGHDDSEDSDNYEMEEDTEWVLCSTLNLCRMWLDFFLFLFIFICQVLWQSVYCCNHWWQMFDIIIIVMCFFWTDKTLTKSCRKLVQQIMQYWKGLEWIEGKTTLRLVWLENNDIYSRQETFFSTHLSLWTSTGFILLFQNSSIPVHVLVWKDLK